MDIWIWDLIRKTLTRLTFDKSDNMCQFGLRMANGLFLLRIAMALMASTGRRQTARERKRSLFLRRIGRSFRVPCRAMEKS